MTHSAEQFRADASERARRAVAAPPTRADKHRPLSVGGS